MSDDLLRSLREQDRRHRFALRQKRAEDRLVDLRKKHSPHLPPGWSVGVSLSEAKVADDDDDDDDDDDEDDEEEEEDDDDDNNEGGRDVSRKFKIDTGANYYYRHEETGKSLFLDLQTPPGWCWEWRREGEEGETAADGTKNKPKKRYLHLKTGTKTFVMPTAANEADIFKGFRELMKKRKQGKVPAGMREVRRNEEASVSLGDGWTMHMSRSQKAPFYFHQKSNKRYWKALGAGLGWGWEWATAEEEAGNASSSSSSSSTILPNPAAAAAATATATTSTTAAAAAAGGGGGGGPGGSVGQSKVWINIYTGERITGRPEPPDSPARRPGSPRQSSSSPRGGGGGDGVGSGSNRHGERGRRSRSRSRSPWSRSRSRSHSPRSRRRRSRSRSRSRSRDRDRDRDRDTDGDRSWRRRERWSDNGRDRSRDRDRDRDRDRGRRFRSRSRSRSRSRERGGYGARRRERDRDHRDRRGQGMERERERPRGPNAKRDQFGRDIVTAASDETPIVQAGSDEKEEGELEEEGEI